MNIMVCRFKFVKPYTLIECLHPSAGHFPRDSLNSFPNFPPTV